jgi:uncharacterized tellurite resistance protein B-like protein
MPQLRELMEKVLVDGKIDRPELTALSDLLYAAGRIDREEAEFLVELSKRLEWVSPAFERFYYTAIKRHLLSDRAVSPEEVAWLRQMVFTHDRVSEREWKLIQELRGEAKHVCPAFEALYVECEKSIADGGRG